jgi:hypothetical protein
MRDPREETASIEGTVTALQRDDRGSEVVLQGIVVPAAGPPIAFHMRGDHVRGVLEKGHRVRLLPGPHTAADGIIGLTELQNLTTNSLVKVWSPPLRHRAVKLAGPVFASAVSAMAAAVAVALIQSSDAGDLLLGVLSVIAIGAAVAGIFVIFQRLYVKPRRAHRHALGGASAAG